MIVVLCLPCFSHDLFRLQLKDHLEVKVHPRLLYQVILLRYVLFAGVTEEGGICCVVAGAGLRLLIFCIVLETLTN